MVERTWIDDKWVRVMCDFAADGLWAKSGGSVGPEDLPVSDDIKARLRKWQDYFERHNQSYLPPGERDTEFDVVAFSAEGLAIAKAIKAALPDWTVVYFDESRCTYGDADQRREEYEYEVSL